MLNCRICQVICCVLVISTLGVYGQRPKKCAEVDEYCQIHSDCCTNSCLTYLYRCTRNYSGLYPYGFLGGAAPATGTFEDVMAFTFSNFGNVEEMKRQQNAQQHHTHQQHHHHHEPQQPHRYSAQFVDEVINDGEYMNDEAPKQTIEETLSSTESPLAATQILESENSNSVSNNVAIENRVSQDKECKVIGLKCYRNEECCTQRCHGFLHQCVT